MSQRTNGLANMLTSHKGPSPELGDLVRLRRLSPWDLPAHASLTKLQANTKPATVNDFATRVLAEAEQFTTAYWPAHFKTKSAARSSPPSIAKVELLAHDIDVDSLPDSVRGGAIAGVAESWFARSSVHANATERGTADWAEFERYLLDDHSEHEKDYTPAVYDAHRVLSWGPPGEVQVEGWEKVEVAIYEMCHTLPTPLHNRVFSVIVVKGRRKGGGFGGGGGGEQQQQQQQQPAFLTAQIPVNIDKVDESLYSHGKNKEQGKGEQRKEVTPGIYVSVERAELLDAGGKIKWQMATASDAGGMLPHWAQKLGVPGAVVKDVGLFMDWVSLMREGKTWTDKNGLFTDGA